MLSSLSRWALQTCNFRKTPQPKIEEHHFKRNRQADYKQFTKDLQKIIFTNKQFTEDLGVEWSSSRPLSVLGDYTRQGSCCVLRQHHSTAIPGQGRGYLFNIQYVCSYCRMGRTLNIFTKFVRGSAPSIWTSIRMFVNICRNYRAMDTFLYNWNH